MKGSKKVPTPDRAPFRKSLRARRVCVRDRTNKTRDQPKDDPIGSERLATSLVKRQRCRLRAGKRLVWTGCGGLGSEWCMMLGDPAECRQRAMFCILRASECKSPAARQTILPARPELDPPSRAGREAVEGFASPRRFDFIWETTSLRRGWSLVRSQRISL